MLKKMRRKCAVTRQVVRFVAVLLLAPAVGAAPWKFAVFCDSRGASGPTQGSDHGVRSSALRPIAAAAMADGVELAIFPGDLANGSTNAGSLTAQWAAWKAALAPLYEANVKVYPCRGNHENQQDRPPGQAQRSWRSFFNDLPTNGPPGQVGFTYSVVHENACFIAFDQYLGRSKRFNRSRFDGTTNSGMVSPWVIQEILHAQTPWVFAFGHETAFIGHHADCLANVPLERDQLWDALGARGGLYFCGHDHMYVRRVAPDRAGRGVLELVVGSGGGPFYSYDHGRLNAKYDRHVVPMDEFVNAGGANTRRQNTRGLSAYFGYLLVTVDGLQLTGEWKAFVNYDYLHWKAPAHPQFQTLDRFVLTNPGNARP